MPRNIKLFDGLAMTSANCLFLIEIPIFDFELSITCQREC